jgi:hypothetical protein
MEEIAIREAAAQMIARHGGGAEIAAALKADKMLNMGNIAGFYDWNWIAAVIGGLEKRSSERGPK